MKRTQRISPLPYPGWGCSDAQGLLGELPARVGASLSISIWSPPLARTMRRRALGPPDEAGRACREAPGPTSLRTDEDSKAQRAGPGPSCTAGQGLSKDQNPGPVENGFARACVSVCLCVPDTAHPLQPSPRPLLPSALSGPPHTLILLPRIPSLTLLDQANSYPYFKPGLSFPTTQSSRPGGRVSPAAAAVLGDPCRASDPSGWKPGSGQQVGLIHMGRQGGLGVTRV